MIKNAPVCQEKCPAGQKKNAKGDECELDCPLGKQANAAGDKCEITCPKGEKPNSNGDKCQKESENKTGCKDGETKTNPRATCHKCPDSQKPGPDGTKCIPETNNDKNKDGKSADKPKTDAPKDEADRKKRIQRAGFCMAFTGVALGGIEGLDFASEAGAALINAEAAEYVENEWPSNMPFKEMDLGNSNIEPEFDKSAKSGNARRRKRLSGFVEGQNELVRRGTQSDSDNVNSIASAQWTPIFRADLSSPQESHLQIRDPAAPAIAGGLVGGVIAGVTRLIIGAVSNVALRSAGSWSNKIANNAAQTGKAYQSTKPGAVAPSKTAEQAGKTAANPAAKPPNFADKVKNIKNDKSFKDCLAIAAVASVGSMAFHAGQMIPKGGFKPEPRALVVTVFENEDNKGGKESTIQTFNDDFYHYDRLVPDKCADFSGTMDNKISGYEVLGGCCRFYKDKGCKGSLFAATNRGDKHLGKDVKDVMSSYAYTFDTTCKDLPP